MVGLGRVDGASPFSVSRGGFLWAPPAPGTTKLPREATRPGQSEQKMAGCASPKCAVCGPTFRCLWWPGVCLPVHSWAQTYKGIRQRETSRSRGQPGTVWREGALHNLGLMSCDTRTRQPLRRARDRSTGQRPRPTGLVPRLTSGQGQSTPPSHPASPSPGFPFPHTESVPS